jgi:hypothetical protein
MDLESVGKMKRIKSSKTLRKDHEMVKFFGNIVPD